MSGAGDTIFALASAAGRAGIAVMRLSGPRAGAALCALTGRSLPAPRRATLATLRYPRNGELLDRALLLWFPAPASYSGEDMAELHLHGGRAVVAGVADALAAMVGLRPAEAGEFTRRAVLNGRMDLTAAEGLADLIAADTAAQRRQALRQTGGGLAGRIEDWAARLAALLAEAEAAIDFSDEADVPAGLSARAAEGAAALAAELEAAAAETPRAERLREGLSIAIIGAPNAGKSSLINILAGRPAAIVSARAGTTRDVVEVHLDLGGYPALLADTAGLREAAGDEIEAEGIRRALARAREADLGIALFDAAAWPALDPATLAAMAGGGGSTWLPVLNKADLRPDLAAAADGGALAVAGRPALLVSALTGAGIEALVATLSAEARARLESDAPAPLTRVRHQAAVREAAEALRRAGQAPLPELAAEDLRLGLRALGRITGRVGVEALLDLIFREFCIGK